MHTRSEDMVSSSAFLRRYRLQIVLRSSLIVLLGGATLYFAAYSSFWLLSVWTGLGFILMLAGLIRYTEGAYRELLEFLLALEQNDFSRGSPGKAPDAAPLTYAFHKLSRIFQRLRSEKESHYQYLQTIIEHIGIAIICYGPGEEISLMNQAARDLFRKPYLRDLKALEKLVPGLPDRLRLMTSGSRQSLRLPLGAGQATFAVQATAFKLLDQPYKLISFQNIQTQLDAQEVDAWQKLIRVLTHEIMNSVIPISSLSEIACQLIEGMAADPSALEAEDIEDLQGSLRTISSRSQGLVKFVKAYKSLSPQTGIQREAVAVDTLFERVSGLLRHQLEKQGIQLSLRVHPPDLSLQADADLMEQVLINLLINAAEALEGYENGNIRLEAATQARGSMDIKITDNGSGIPEQVQEHMFVPFYTTKGQGSGVGLSLVRQIVQQHGGSIQVQSTPGAGTSITLCFDSAPLELEADTGVPSPPA